jgi:hypothetical protein
MRKLFLNTFSLLIYWAVLVAPALAAVSVSPRLVDETLAPRDQTQTVIVLENPTEKPTRVFASVNPITLTDGGSISSFIPASLSDGRTSVTSWLAIDRGRIELPSGASTTIPLTIKIHPAAVAGLYHAFIGFGGGTNRDEAEAEVLSGGAPGVIVRILITDERSTNLKLSGFTAKRLLLGESADALTYTLTNAGELPLSPTGEIVLFNTRGEEIINLPLSESAVMIPPGETISLSLPLTTAGLFGRYKALLTVRYGETQTATLTDTAFFYAAPLPYLGGLFALLFGLSFWLMWLGRHWYRRTRETSEHDGAVLPLYVGRTDSRFLPHERDITLTKKDHHETAL